MGLLDKIKEKIAKDQETKEQYYSQSGANWFQTLFNTGVKGEYLTYKKLGNISGNNRCIANCYIPKEDGTTSEIDMLMIHETGIYVFESKNYSGYIFGSSSQRMWTQTLPARHGRVEKHQFYNPIMQNKTHIKCLRALLKDDSIPMFSYIVFSDRCEFKGLEVDISSRVVHRSKLMRVLNNDIKDKPVLLSEDRIKYIFDVLDKQSHKDASTKHEHVREVKDEKQRIEQCVADGICPKCGGQLVLRTASKGPNAGSQFYGCSNFPRCKFTAKAPKRFSLF